MTRRSTVAQPPTLVSAKFHCPELGREVDVPAEELWFSETILPDNHGIVDANFLCSCGNNHYVTVIEW